MIDAIADYFGESHNRKLVDRLVEQVTIKDAEKPKYLAEWVLRRTGPLTSSVAEAFAFVRSRPGLPAPDLQFHFAPAYFNENGFDDVISSRG